MKKIPPKTVLPKPSPGTTRIIGYGGPITRKVLQWPFYLSYGYEAIYLKWRGFFRTEDIE